MVSDTLSELPTGDTVSHVHKQFSLYTSLDCIYVTHITRVSFTNAKVSSELTHIT